MQLRGGERRLVFRMYRHENHDHGAKLTPEDFERQLAEREEEFRNRSLAPNTRRGYESDWKDFTARCAEHGPEALPASAATVSAISSTGARRWLRRA